MTTDRMQNNHGEHPPPRRPNGNGDSDEKGRGVRDLAAELQIHQVELEMQNQELRETQASLEVSRRRYFSLFDLAPVPYLLFAEKHAIAEMNLAAGELLEIARGELWMHPFSMSLTEESRPIFHDHLRKVFSGVAGATAELRLITRNGRLKHVIMRSALLEGENGHARQALTACFDITEAREAEIRQKALEAELQRAQKLEALGILAGGMAHEFNNILQVIIGSADIALQERDPQVAGGYIEQVRAAGKRASQLTGQILAFSRRQPMESAVVNLNQLLSSLSPMLERLLKTGVEIRTTLEAELPSIQADRGKIEQILMNLVLNACDAIELGGTIEITTGFRPGSLQPSPRMAGGEARDAVALTVKDSGMGMTAGTLSRIFEPFFTTKPRARGTGLGLAVVHGIVQQHGGDIKVDSSPGQGTTFTLLFPATANLASVEEHKQPNPAAGGGQLVLLADDEVVLRRLVEKMLTRNGYQVLSACDGEEAVELFRAHAGPPIALLLFDVMMPRKSGIEAYETLRDHPQCPPVLFISGYPGDTAIQVQRTRPVRFLRKPFLEEELMVEVARCLKLEEPASS